MLELYRRHSSGCKFFKHPQAQQLTKCTCPIHAYEFVNGVRVRRSLKTRDWGRALKKAEEVDVVSLSSRAISVTDAVEKYIRDCRTRGVKESTLESYRKTFAHLCRHCEGMVLKDIKLPTLQAFRASRIYTPNKKGSEPRQIKTKTAVKELEHLRMFLTFCQDNEWITSNPAKKLKPPKDQTRPTLPFSQEEVTAILRACERLPHGDPSRLEETRGKARARVLVMLYGGLRISDTIKLERSTVNLSTGFLRIRTMKTGHDLGVTLRPVAVAALKALPSAGKYFFWTGRGDLITAIKNARRSVQRVLKVAEVTGHPHRFRDTFAVRLLENNVSLQTVKDLLGHASLRTTEKYYAPWVPSRQRLLDEAIAQLAF